MSKVHPTGTVGCPSIIHLWINANYSMIGWVLLAQHESNLKWPTVTCVTLAVGYKELQMQHCLFKWLYIQDNKNTCKCARMIVEAVRVFLQLHEFVLFDFDLYLPQINVQHQMLSLFSVGFFIYDEICFVMRLYTSSFIFRKTEFSFK